MRELSKIENNSRFNIPSEPLRGEWIWAASVAVIPLIASVFMPGYQLARNVAGIKAKNIRGGDGNRRGSF